MATRYERLPQVPYGIRPSGVHHGLTEDIPMSSCLAVKLARFVTVITTTRVTGFGGTLYSADDDRELRIAL